MPRKPDTPCAGCGKLLWGGGTGSLPAGQRKCRTCRTAPVRSIGRPCAGGCGATCRRFRGDPATCSSCRPTTCTVPGCVKPHDARGYCKTHYGKLYDPERAKARGRAKTHLRKAVGRLTDITLDYEQALRAKAKRCPLCKVKLINKPYQVASKELDHMIPLNTGGTHTIGNVRIICRGCNLARPKDGSDYAGPVTLWAEQPGFIQPARKLRARQCDHGIPTYDRCYVCRPPLPTREVDGRRAAELRAQGWQWRDIATQVGMRPSNAGAMARKYGAPDVIAQWPSDDPLCRGCGVGLPRGAVGRPRMYCTQCRPARPVTLGDMDAISDCYLGLRSRGA